MPELALMLVTDLAVLDHTDGTVLLIANALDPSDAGYDDAVTRLDAMAVDLTKAVPPGVATLATDVDALDLYRVLRVTNPSPYMYLLRFAGRESPFDVVGSSPEALVTVTGERAVVHPPAGTRPRGATPEDDVRLAEELLGDLCGIGVRVAHAVWHEGDGGDDVIDRAREGLSSGARVG